MTLNIGLIGIVGSEMKEDPWKTLEKVAAVGYDGVEGAAGIAARAALPLPEMKARLEALGLRPAPQGAVRIETTDEQLEQAIANALAIGSKYMVQYWAPCDSRDQLLQFAEYFNKVGRKCRQAGLRFCYHNHDHEFKTFDGKYGLEILLDNTEPEHLSAELDVAWVTYGGADPVAFMRKYAGRCPLLHVKDIVKLEEGCETAAGDRQATQFTEVGTGIVNIRGCVEAAEECGVDWLIVEQDRMRDLTPMESIKVSHDNLRGMVAASGSAG